MQVQNFALLLRLLTDLSTTIVEVPGVKSSTICVTSLRLFSRKQDLTVQEHEALGSR